MTIRWVAVPGSSYTYQLSHKKGRNSGRHSKHCRVNMDIKVANSQVLDKPWLDFSMDVVPSRRLGHRKRRSVT